MNLSTISISCGRLATVTFEPGTSIIYMKVGEHAREDLRSILARKGHEIEEAGFSMWGYGGNTCHPRTMVQPFARAASSPIVLCMEPMKSHHLADRIRAEDYSVDGITWNPIPPSINVLGSRYALCIDTLEEVDVKLDLSETRVALGNSRGRSGGNYIRGRVDKACLNLVEERADEPREIHIGVMARLVEPFAVLLRGGLEIVSSEEDSRG